MRIYVLADLEGVAGVLNYDEWCGKDSRYHDLAKELLTREVNAAVDGFFAAGATDVVVADGHWPGGISPVLLDERTELMRGWPTEWPLLLDESYDFVAFVGQHAKAGTEYAHLPHTEDWVYLDLTVNGLSIGEFGEFALCAGELGIPTIFAAGDQALCDEARALLPGIETVAVKRGTTPGRGDELEAEAYGRRNISAIHLHPERACKLIRAGAEAALRRALAQPFGVKRLQPPYERVVSYRAQGEQPRSISITRHPSSLAGALSLPLDLRPLL